MKIQHIAHKNLTNHPWFLLDPPELGCVWTGTLLVLMGPPRSARISRSVAPVSTPHSSRLLSFGNSVPEVESFSEFTKFHFLNHKKSAELGDFRLSVVYGSFVFQLRLLQKL